MDDQSDENDKEEGERHRARERESGEIIKTVSNLVARRLISLSGIAGPGGTKNQRRNVICPASLCLASVNLKKYNNWAGRHIIQSVERSCKAFLLCRSAIP